MPVQIFGVEIARLKGGTSDFWLKYNIFFPVNAKMTPIAYVI
jgi:hypothetical protein